jgi:LacI family transcriptional regulator
MNFQRQQLGVVSGHSLRHVFYDDVFMGIRARAYASDIDLLLLTELSAREASRPSHYPEICRRHGASGIIVTAFEPHDSELAQIAASDLPCVAIDTHMLNPQASFVTSDNVGGAVAAVRHLGDSGKKRIAFVGGVAGSVASSNRRLGYGSALEGLGLESRDELVIETDWLPRTAYEKVRELLALSEPPDAFFCVSDELALGTMLAIEESGRSIPGDVAVVGFDDADFARLTTPSLTSVRQDRVGLGAAAIETLLRMLEDPSAPFPVSILPVELIVRESSLPLELREKQAPTTAPEVEESEQPAEPGQGQRLSIAAALSIFSSGEGSAPSQAVDVPAPGDRTTAGVEGRRLIAVMLGATPAQSIPGTFIDGLFLDLRAQAHAREIDLLLLPSFDAVLRSPQQSFVEQCRRLGVRGLVVLALREDERVSVSSALADFPCVTVGIDLLGARVAFVMSNNIDGAAQAVHHLAESGCRRIAFIGGPAESRATIDRRLGYKSELERLGLEYREEFVAGANWLAQPAREEMKRMLSQPEPPDGVFCCSDVMAIGAMAAIEEAGLSIPEDVAVVGFDDVDYASLVTPTLTTVRQDRKKVAEAAIEAILQLFERPDEAPPVSLLPVELVVRESAPGATRHDPPV